MKNEVRSSLYQAFGPAFLLIPVLAALVIGGNLLNPLLQARATGGLVQDTHVQLLADAFQAQATAAFLPILAVLPFAGAYVEDVKTKFARFFLIRSSIWDYCLGRVIAAFLSGGLGLLLGALALWGGGEVLFPPLERAVEGMAPISREVLVESCVLLFLNGGLWAVVGMATSTLMESKYISYCAPFVLYYLLVILCERYFPDVFFLYPPNWLNPDVWPYGVWGAALFLLEITVLFAILFAFRAGRRLGEL